MQHLHKFISPNRSSSKNCIHKRPLTVKGLEALWQLSQSHVAGSRLVGLLQLGQASKWSSLWVHFLGTTKG